MAFDYDRIVNTVVIPQIRDKGIDVTLTRVLDVAGVWEHKFDPVTFEEYWQSTVDSSIVYVEPTGGTSTFTAKAVITDFTENEREDSTIKAGDKKVLTIELEEPLPGDTITAQGVTYQYVNHKNIAPAGVDVLYKIQVRV